MNPIKRSVKLILENIWKPSKSAPVGPLEKQLQKILGVARWEQMFRDLSERKSLVPKAADLLQVSEHRLIQVMAARLGLGYIEKPLPMDLSILPSQLAVDDFEREAVIATTSHGIITGVICSNPALLNRMVPSYHGSNIQLSTVSAIEEALRITRSHAAMPKSQRNHTDIATAVIEQIVEEAMGYNAEIVTIVFNAKDASYSFDDNTGKSLAGTILSRAANQMAEKLAEAVAEKDGKVILPSGQTLEVQAHASVFKLFIQHKNTDSTKLISSVEVKAFKNIIPRRVLLVDDSETFSHVLEKFLAREGITATRINDADKALAYLNETEELPSLIISDVRMPGMNGFEFLKRLHSLPYSKNIPVIMLTSDEDLETELSLLRDGAAAFVPKNKNPEVLKAHALRLLRMGAN